MILHWILVFELDNSLSNASSPINSLCNILSYSPYIFTHTHPYATPKAIRQSSKTAEQNCLHFCNLFLIKYLSNLLLQVQGFCLPGFNKTQFQLLLLFSIADNIVNFLHEDKCFSFPVEEQQGVTGMRAGIKLNNIFASV